MIKGHLQSLEKEQLSQFRFGFEVDSQNELIIESKDLLNEKILINYLQIVKEKIHAPNMMVTASLFSKRYSYLLVVPALYSMTRLINFLMYLLKT